MSKLYEETCLEVKICVQYRQEVGPLHHIEGVCVDLNSETGMVVW